MMEAATSALVQVLDVLPAAIVCFWLGVWSERRWRKEDNAIGVKQ